MLLVNHDILLVQIMLTWSPILKDTRPILGLHPANERRRYIVTTSLIGCVQA